jgi:small subunit ribosomal protein S17
MADEKDDETPKAAEEAAPQATDAPEPDAAQADAADDSVQVDAGAPDEPAASGPDASEPRPADRAAAPQSSEPAEQLSPKERRRRERSKHAGQARAPRSAEDRHAERVVERQRKAVRRRARRQQERAKAAERRAAAPSPEPLPPVHAAVEGSRRMRQGIVISDKAEKTITVRIDVARRHRRYEKIVRSSSTLHAHDENNDAHEGDVVRVIESRPLSRTKRWALVDVLERAR